MFSSPKTSLLGFFGGVILIGVTVYTGHPLDAQTLTIAAALFGMGAAARDHNA